MYSEPFYFPLLNHKSKQFWEIFCLQLRIDKPNNWIFHISLRIVLYANIAECGEKHAHFEHKNIIHYLYYYFVSIIGWCIKNCFNTWGKKNLYFLSKISFFSQHMIFRPTKFYFFFVVTFLHNTNNVKCSINCNWMKIDIETQNICSK